MKDRKISSDKLRSWVMPSAFFLAVVLWILLMFLFFHFYASQDNGFYSLRGQYRVILHDQEGGEAEYTDGVFRTLTQGERLEVFPDLASVPEMEAPELYLPLYNAVVQIYDGEELLYADEPGENAAKFYGSRIYEVPLPRAPEEMELRLEIQTVVRMPASDLQEMGIVPANQAWTELIRGKELDFCLFLTLIILSLLFAFFFLLQSLHQRKLQIGLPISLFELLIGIWFFCNLSLHYILLPPSALVSKLEYYALYAAPLMMCVFIRMLVDRPGYRKAANIVSVYYLLFYLVTTALELSPLPVNYSQMLTYMHVSMGVTAAVLMLGLFRGVSKRKSRHVQVLRNGITVALIMGIIELIRFNLVLYLLQTSWISTHGFSQAAILVVAASLVTYLIVVSSDEYAARIERQQLMVLAYRDSLTGIPNRAACFRDFETMEKEKIQEYTMIFLDLNNLKYANDHFGHEMGDRLLEKTGSLLKEVFAATGYVGRWGGDEFIACVYGPPEKAEALMEKFRQRVEEVNDQQEFPFAYSMAMGHVVSRPDAPVDPVEAVRQADDRMYDNKRQDKTIHSR